ncbi:MAG: heavy-metal-associated domain-containing protein [Bacteriovoracaceae bacterium]|nr:heavy-metal-associated domain-containing protein [Bacteriovoracaceae bacterium]
MQQKIISTIMFLTIFLSFTGCATKEKTNSLSKMYPNMQIRTYEVFGMDCPGCHGGIEKLVKEVPNVVDAKANWDEKKITIVIKKEATIEDKTIFEAIKRANFTPGKRIQ